MRESNIVVDVIIIIILGNIYGNNNKKNVNILRNLMNVINKYRVLLLWKLFVI